MRYLIIVLLPFLFQCTSKTKLTPIERFPYLLFEYEARGKSNTFKEAWQAGKNGSLIGNGVTVRDGKDTIMTEQLAIRLIDGDYYYISKVSNQNRGEEVLFKIVQVNDSSFIAENPAHDFPKRISYQLKSRDYLYVVVDDGLAIDSKKIEFHLIKKQP